MAAYSSGQASFEDTWNELKYCIPEEFLVDTRALMLKFFREFRLPEADRDVVVTSGATWIERAINQIKDEGNTPWLLMKAQAEQFDMPAKTPERMENIRAITGLARIMFTTLVNCDWVPPFYKAFLFCCADAEHKTEHPAAPHHEISTDAEEGDGKIHLLLSEGHFYFADRD